MSKNKVKPTESELEILKVLWVGEPLTVRDVFDRLGGKGGYTTVLKFMQIMAEKGLVDRDESKRAHLYKAAVHEADVKQQAVTALAGKLFGGSGLRLAMQALSEEEVSVSELSQIRTLIEKMESDQTNERK
jgi:predicted transcriptional regulator